METRLSVTVKPGSKTPGIAKAAESVTLRVRECAIEGAANAACIRALAEIFHIAPSRITLIRGERSRQKLFAIRDMDEAALAALITASSRG
ncbi:MAG: DUF167 domain-containing protein [Vulcanimicrobiaceae bacterium]